METPIGNTVFLLNHNRNTFFKAIGNQTLHNANESLGPMPPITIGELRKTAGIWMRLLDYGDDFDSLSVEQCTKLESILQVQTRLVDILDTAPLENVSWWSQCINHIIPLEKMHNLLICWDAIPLETRIKHGETFFARNPQIIHRNNWKLNLIRSPSYIVSQRIRFAQLCGHKSVFCEFNNNVEEQLIDAGYILHKHGNIGYICLTCRKDEQLVVNDIIEKINCISKGNLVNIPEIKESIKKLPCSREVHGLMAKLKSKFTN
jgi:hypothetical protein